MLRAVAELDRRDPHLAGVVRRWGPPPMWSLRPGFATLVRIILGQQVSQASANAVYDRLRAGLGRVTALRLAGVSPGALQNCGVTRQKADYLHNAARLVVSGELDLRSIAYLSDSAARQRLLDLRGVGPWSADVYLLMAAGRPDIWPDGDLALAEAAKQVKQLRARPTPDRLRRLAATWRPWRSVAARILWHHYLSERRSRHRA
jgi:DNA-3-methyladenine glycosylase II